MNDRERYEFLLAKKAKKRLDPKEFKEFKKLESKLKGSSDDSEFKPGNDYSWWSKYPEIIKDAANLKCNWIAGTPLAKKDINYLFVPGVVKFQMFNTYGAETSVTDPINMAARNIYLKMFQKYRGISSYEASDLAITFIATIELFQYIAKLERIYGVINQYDILNRAIPTQVLAALNISGSQADAIRNRLSDFRYDLNNLILKAQRVILPKDMSILTDRLSLYGYLYKDHESTRSQVIVFDYNNVGVFDETAISTGGSVRFDVLSNNGLNLTDATKIMFPKLDEMINALLTSESVIKMYGDLLAYFGSDQMVTLLPLPENFVVTPVYSESILHKMHNAETLGGAASEEIFPWVKDGMSGADSTVLLGDKRYIYQSDGVVYTLSCLGTAASETYNIPGSGTIKLWNVMLCNQDSTHILDSYRADFSEETVVEGSLWKYNLNFVRKDSISPGYLIDSCGPEIIQCIYVYTRYDEDATHHQTHSVYTYPQTTAGVSDASWLTCLDWAPLVYQSNQVGQYAYAQVRIIGDVDNARWVSDNDIARIQKAALLSAFRSDIQVRIGGTPNS